MTIDGEPVVTTVTPMASGDLSVALVIDTASGLTSQELAAVQSGATEFLLRLPDGARTMVVTAAGQPQVVAPLSGRRAEALSAISALRVGGSRATMPATMLAAQSLESAPPGPRAIIVYTHGVDEQGVLTTRLSQAVQHAEAVLNVIQTSTDSLWPSVVDQTGGSVVTTTAENIAQVLRKPGRHLGPPIPRHVPGPRQASSGGTGRIPDRRPGIRNRRHPARRRPSASRTNGIERRIFRHRRPLAGRAAGRRDRRARVDRVRCVPRAPTRRRPGIHRGGQPTDRRSATRQRCWRQRFASASCRQGCTERASRFTVR